MYSPHHVFFSEVLPFILTCYQIPYTNAVDVHSFGMILYEMAHRGRRPYWQVAGLAASHFVLVFLAFSVAS